MQVTSAAILAIASCLAATNCVIGQVAQFDLANYRHTRTHALFVPEASSITYHPERRSFFVIGDEGEMIGEFNRFGTGLSLVNLSGFEDTEGITYVGNGQFAIVEERNQGVSLLTWPASTSPEPTIARSSLPRVALGPDLGNSGLEGICFDPVTDRFLIVKEKDPQRVLSTAVDFQASIFSSTDLCPPGPLGVNDLADLTVLSVVVPLSGSPDRDNILFISQASSRLVVATRTGVVQSTFSLSGISGTAEGVTIDERGVIYIVDESPNLYVLEPCRGDFNWHGGVTLQDLFDFLAAYFDNDLRSDVNSSGDTTVADIFDFLSTYFTGC